MTERPRQLLPTLLALSGLLIAGFILRIANVHEYTLNPDEVMFVYTADQESLAEVWSTSLLNVHPPANYFMLHFMLKLSADPLWLRIPSLLAGTLLIGLAYLLAKELFGRSAGFTAAFLVTFSPGLIELSRVCRNYSPGLALLIVSLYFLLRFLDDRRWSSMLLFALFELLAATWLYSFVVVIISANLYLVLVLITRRHPARSWMQAALAQLPLLALLTFLYFAHIRHFDTSLDEWMRETMADQFAVSLRSLFFPLNQVFRYLLPDWIARAALYLSLLGAATLAVNKRFEALAFCAIPILIAYAFAVAGQLPLGTTRHSAYLFPFLFGLIACQAPELLTAYRSTRRELSRILSRGTPPSNTESAEPPVNRISPPGLAVLAILGLAFMAFALADYRSGVTWDSVEGFGARQAELPDRAEDLEATLELLQENARENDFVILNHLSLLLLRFFLDHEPIELGRELPDHFTYQGLDFYYSPKADQGVLRPASFLRAFGDLRETLGLETPDRVWAIRTGWDPSLTALFRRDFPAAAIDVSIAEQSGHRLFAIDGATAADLAAALNRIEEPARTQAP